MKEATEYFRDRNNEKDEEFEDQYDIANEDEADDIINKRLSETNSDYRSDTGNKYIQYEELEPKDCIFYYANGDWNIDAIDNFNDNSSYKQALSLIELGNDNYTIVLMNWVDTKYYIYKKQNNE